MLVAKHRIHARLVDIPFPSMLTWLCLFLFLKLRFLLNHTKQCIASPLQLPRRPALEEPVEPEHGEFREAFLNPLVHIFGLHAIMERAGEKVSVFFLTVDLSLRSWIVQLQLLHGVSYGVDLLGEKVVPLISLSFIFIDPSSNTWIFYAQCERIPASLVFREW
jgi:hypothetical protein